MGTVGVAVEGVEVVAVEVVAAVAVAVAETLRRPSASNSGRALIARSTRVR
jgi:hypothetical protein